MTLQYQINHLLAQTYLSQFIPYIALQFRQILFQAIYPIQWNLQQFQISLRIHSRSPRHRPQKLALSIGQSVPYIPFHSPALNIFQLLLNFLINCLDKHARLLKTFNLNSFMPSNRNVNILPNRPYSSLNLTRPQYLSQFQSTFLNLLCIYHARGSSNFNQWNSKSIKPINRVLF